MNKTIIILATLGLLAGPALAGMADPVVVGDNIRFYDRPGDPGGEFGVRNNTQNIGTAANPAWVTFCVQRDEFLDYDAAGFTVVGIGDTIQLQNEKLSPQAAWLYTAFRQGTLLDVGSTPYDGSEADAKSLQQAIWHYQNEPAGTLSADATKWISDAQAAFDGGFTTIANVRVVNIEWAHDGSGYHIGDAGQDVLAMVPAPGAAILGAIGFGLVGWMKRRAAQ